MKRSPFTVHRLLFYFLLLTFNFLLLTSHFSALNAADPKEELKEIQKKLGQKKQKVEETIKKERSILTDLEEIERAIKKKVEELKYYNAMLTQTRSKIRILDGEIRSLNDKLKKRKLFLRERLRRLYKQQHGDIAVILVSAEDYQDLIKKSRYLSFIAYYDRKLIDAYSKDLVELNRKMQEMEVLKKELEVQRQAVKNKTEEMQAERRRKDTLLASVRKERHTYEKMVKELEESSKRLLQMIRELEKKEALPPPSGKGFTAFKGRIPWPVEGKILVPFGSYKDPEFNMPVFKNGIEIQGGQGEAARAVSGGKVVYADWFKGYGQLLIINHGDGYHSLYAHLSEIFHKVGDIIREYQPVGRIGGSGIFNVPSLYFELRHKGKPLNPIHWLKKK